jgi:hypothetical protein
VTGQTALEEFVEPKYVARETILKELVEHDQAGKITLQEFVKQTT